MNIAAQTLALIAAAVHVMIFVLESVRFGGDPKVQKSFQVASADVAAVRPWAFNQGFYNLFLAAGTVLGLIAAWSGSPGAGRLLTGFTCASMAAAAAVLAATDRRMLRAALVQGTAPLLALALIWL